MATLVIRDRTYSSPGMYKVETRRERVPEQGRLPVGEGPTRTMMVGSIAWRRSARVTVRSETPRQESILGGRAIRRAVTRVKSEQAPKALLWTPTLRLRGEGSTDREEPGAGARHNSNHRASVRSTGVVDRALRKGNQSEVGETRKDCGYANVAARGRRIVPGVGKGQRYRGSRVMPVEGRALASDMFVKKGRDR